MELKSKIIGVLKNIELQEEAIDELQKIKEAKKTTNLNPDEDIAVISKNLENDKESLPGLKRQYDRGMLTRMVRGGIQDDEMMGWWMNRY